MRNINRSEVKSAATHRINRKGKWMQNEAAACNASCVVKHELLQYFFNRPKGWRAIKCNRRTALHPGLSWRQFFYWRLFLKHRAIINVLADVRPQCMSSDSPWISAPASFLQKMLLLLVMLVYDWLSLDTGSADALSSADRSRCLQRLRLSWTRCHNLNSLHIRHKPLRYTNVWPLKCLSMYFSALCM